VKGDRLLNISGDGVVVISVKGEMSVEYRTMNHARP